MGRWDDTGKLFFLLYDPEHTFDRFTDPDTAVPEETIRALRFDNRHSTKVRIVKGIGEVILHREIPNWKTGEEFATTWETENVTEEGYSGLRFAILKRTSDMDAKMTVWNKDNPDEPYFRLRIQLRGWINGTSIRGSLFRRCKPSSWRV
jgi:hypothetical protein